MVGSYDLSQLNPHAVEHLVNALALRVLGAGHTGFGPGPDGGRDGYFRGDAPYPSTTERWNGVWYVQSKFHAPKLSGDEQKWLLRQIKDELTAFAKPNTQRVWPNNWIVATNVVPSGVPSDQFLALLADRPRVGLTVWRELQHPELMSPPVLEAVAQALVDDPVALDHVPAARWAGLVGQEGQVGAQFRRALVRFWRERCGHAREPAQRWEPGARPIAVDLPEEQALLVPLALSLVTADDRELVRMVAPIRSLDLVAADGGGPLPVRLSAALLAALHPEGDADHMLRAEDVLVDATRQGLHVPLILATIRRVLRVHDPRLRQLASKLIAADPMESATGYDWQGFLRWCRETSRAPVTSDGYLERWLPLANDSSAL